MIEVEEKIVEKFGNRGIIYFTLKTGPAVFDEDLRGKEIKLIVFDAECNIFDIYLTGGIKELERLDPWTIERLKKLLEI